MGRRLFLIIGFVAGFLGSGACRASPQNDILVVGLSQTIPTLDPAMHRDRTAETVIRNIFDGLVTRTPEMQVVPQMAESWRIIDPITWEFKLRKGIRFHNGEPFTAEDVQFTFERILTEGAVEGRSSPRKGLLGPLEEIEIIDDYSVRFRTSKPWPSFIAMLPFQEIVPKDYIEERGSRFFAEHPVGAGPFRFVEWKRSEHIVMSRFDDYYGGSTDIPPVGPAGIVTLIFKPIPETATRVAALKAGECDIIQTVPPHLVNNLEIDARTKILSCRGTRSYYIGMNVTHPPFHDVRVRRAANHAVDLTTVLENILERMATRLPGPLVLGSFGYNEELEPYAFDRVAARRLLDQAGYENGFDVELDTAPDLYEVALAVSSQLAEVGIRAKVRLWEWGVLRTLLSARERSMFLSSWGDASLDSIGILKPTLHSQGRGNYTGYANILVDRLLEDAEVGMDREKRAQYFREAQKIIYDDAPWIFGYSLLEIYGVRTRVKNWSPIPDGRMNMHDVVLAKD